MNQQRSDLDASLDRTLREWRQDAQLAPRFQERVWQRIALLEANPRLGVWSRCRAWLNAAFARPVTGVAYVSVLLLAGLLAGYWHARHDNAQISDQLSSRYVRSMDPYQMPHH